MDIFPALQDAEEVVLQGEKEAEKMIVEAYAALLLAFLSTERFFLPPCLSFFPIMFRIVVSKAENMSRTWPAKAFATLLQVTSRIAAWKFLSLCWRDLW